MALRTATEIYAICPIDDCPVAFEADPDGDYFCPTCKVEMLTRCPQCETPITSPEAVVCARCGGDLKE